MPSPLNITNIPAPRVPLIDERTNLMSREWYRYFLNLFTLTGSGSNPTTLTDLQIGPPSIPSVMENPNIELAVGSDSSGLLAQIAELQKQIQTAETSAEAAIAALQSQIAELQKQAQGAETTDSSAIGALQSQIADLANGIQGLAVTPPTTPNLRRRAYGSFYDLTNQTAALTNTAYAIYYGNTDLSNGVYIGATTSQVYVDRPGVYDIQFSALLDKTSASKGNVWIWLDKNGTSVSDSATQVTLQGSSAATVAAWNFLLQMNAGDYFRLMWSTDDTDCYIKYAASAAPVPAIPSIILTVTDNINAYQD